MTTPDLYCPAAVFEVPDDLPVLIGQVPLEQLDIVIDPKHQSLIGNPLHGGNDNWQPIEQDSVGNVIAWRPCPS